jgi:hypothetical protein
MTSIEATTPSVKAATSAETEYLPGLIPEIV